MPRSRPRAGRRRPEPPPPLVNGLVLVEVLSCLEENAGAVQLALAWAESSRRGLALDDADQPAVAALASTCRGLLDPERRRGPDRLVRRLEEAADSLRATTAALTERPVPPPPQRLHPRIAVRAAIGLDDVARQLAGWWTALARVYEPDGSEDDQAAIAAAEEFARAAAQTRATVTASAGRPTSTTTTSRRAGDPHAAA